MDTEKARTNILKKTVKYIFSICKKIQLNINNRKIRTKTIYLYVFCVLVPVLVTNIFIIGNTLKASHDEGEKNMNNIADSVGHDISTSIEGAAYITVDLYASNAISSFLENKYDNAGEFLREYNRVFDNYVFYASSKNLTRLSAKSTDFKKKSVLFLLQPLISHESLFKCSM